MSGIDFVFNKEFAFFWATLALVNAGLAQSKNRDGLTWFVVSIILGPLATFIILLLKKVEEDL